MKKTLSLLLMVALLMVGNTIFAFAEDDTHVHFWSDWEVVEESTCDTPGSELRECEICGEYEERDLPLSSSHEWDSWVVTRKATPYKVGLKSRTCIECYKVQKKTIPKKKLTKNQKKAVNVVNSYLKAAKSYNVKKMNSLFKKGSKKYGYPTEKIDWVYKKNNKKIKWKMVGITGKGNTIKVNVKVTRPDFYKQAYNTFYETVEWVIYHPNASESQIGNMLVRKYNSKVKNSTKKTSTDTVTFTIVKSGKKWKIKAQTRTLVDIATAFYHQGADNAYDDILYDYSY